MNSFYSDEYLSEINRRIDALANNKNIEENKFVPMEIRNFVNEIKRLNKEKENLTNIVANKIIKDYDIETPLKDELNKERIKNGNLSDENNRLNNIIKEVRKEIIKDREKQYSDLEKKAFYCNKTNKLLEILDKAGGDKE